MAEDEQGKREDLFEDLDKFFAPIRDVDWPEDRPAPRAEEPPRPTPPPTPPAPPMPPTPPPVPGPDVEKREPERRVPADAPARPAREPMRISDEEPEEGYVPLPPVRISSEDEPAPSPEDVEAAAAYFADSLRDEGDLGASDEPGDEPDLVDEGVGSGATPKHIPDTTGEFGSIAALLGEIEGRETEAVPAPRTIVVGPDGMEGPSWQDPTSVEVGSDDRPARRNVPLAALTGLILAGVAVGTLMLGGPWFAILAGAAVILALGEWYQAVRKQGGQPATAVGMASGALLLAAAYLRGEAAMLGMLPLALIATFLWYMAQAPSHRRDVGQNIGSTLFGVAYVGLLAGYALLILGLPEGEGLLMGVVGLTIAYDTAAFAAGYLWGSRPLAPTVSPQKSWEGAIGGTILALGVSIGIVAPAIPVLGTIGRAAALAIVVSVFAPLGDLAESLLKRDLGVKDMGNLLPGHGGILDRIDALLFVMPAAFFFFRLIG